MKYNLKLKKSKNEILVNANYCNNVKHTWMT